MKLRKYSFIPSGGNTSSFLNIFSRTVFIQFSFLQTARRSAAGIVKTQLRGQKKIIFSLPSALADGRKG
jgi:hypothetical protein